MQPSLLLPPWPAAPLACCNPPTLIDENRDPSTRPRHPVCPRTPLSADAGLALYQESENLAFYTAFVVGLSVCGGYFLHANFWFLDIAIGGAPLQAVLITIGLAFVPAALLPALVRATAATADGFSRLLWLNMILIQQGNLVLITEELLFVGCAACCDACCGEHPAPLDRSVRRATGSGTQLASHDPRLCSCVAAWA